MGGGSSHSTTNPTIPPQLSGLYSLIGREMSGAIGDMPLENYYEMDPRQYASMSEAEQAALGLAPGMLNASPSSQAAFNMASQLGNMQGWGGADLSGVGALGQMSQLPGVQLNQLQLPGWGGGAGGGNIWGSPGWASGGGGSGGGGPGGAGSAPPPGGGGAAMMKQGGGGSPPGGGGFGFAGSTYQGGVGPNLGAQVKPRRLPTPFEGAAPAASASS